MVAGDLVSDMFAVTTSVQPAVGVQLCITTMLHAGGDNWVQGRGDIDTVANNLVFTSSTGFSTYIQYWNGFIQKFLIDNDSYINFNITSGICGFSGIQTQ